ncbi:hypothetical protein PBAL39_12583 [Pedobacter sp. BAL39]|uniref:DoxX family protein n=1 Tax=Pedobacter sp. BAL39 TaxID=391596 RepID=UPI000155A2A9|nr:DoxX family protein [Pedobacter sp. BAL39]EDM34303.1 hypothetical protein PBAL39_12583 [Pedobacter sp. BAL39]
MKLLTKIQQWGDQHHPKWVDYLRIVLGIVLIWKGIAFALNLHAFTDLMEGSQLGASVSISLLAHVIIVLHLVGGILIVLGSHTRLFCLLNLPILLVSLVFVDLSQSILSPYSQIWLAVIVFAGLICFMIEGDGMLSIEHEEHPAA